MEDIKLSVEDSKKVKDAFSRAEEIDYDEFIETTQKKLDMYCQKFKASSWQELALRADNGDSSIPTEISIDIVSSYTTLQMKQMVKETVQNTYGEKTRQLA
ncbi:MAG: hypothetical protein OXB88_08480 [Bacteriovoracales bacterium]|nr:hypothetical protein [Bacteriovoracales bacterium]